MVSILFCTSPLVLLSFFWGGGGGRRNCHFQLFASLQKFYLRLCKILFTSLSIIIHYFVFLCLLAVSYNLTRKPRVISVPEHSNLRSYGGCTLLLGKT